MNLYYISSFSKCENMDEKMGLRVPVYYIVFSIIGWDNTEHIQKKYVENINDIGDVDRYYYYRKNDENDNSEYITDENANLFTWCITKC